MVGQNISNDDDDDDGSCQKNEVIGRNTMNWLVCAV